MMTEVVSRLWLMSLQACVLIVIVLIARIMLKRYPKVYSYALWLLVGLRLLCPVLVESPFSLQPAPAQIANVVQNFTTDGMQQSDILPAGEMQTIQPSQIQGVQSAGENGVTAGEAGGVNNRKPDMDSINEYGENKSVNLWKILMIVYLAGVAAVSVFYLVQYLLMRRRVSTAVHAKGNVWYCDKITSPFVMGIFRTRIFLPYGLNERERYYVLKHERTHIRHHDPVILVLGILCICLHWWNPLVWLAVHKMNQDMEMFCDEAALKGLQVPDKKAYAKTLLAFAERQNGFSVELAFGESNTERRVKNLMRKRRRSILIVIPVVLLAVFCAMALLTVREDGSGTQPNENGTQPGGGEVQSDGTGTQPGGGEGQSDGNSTQSGGNDIPSAAVEPSSGGQGSGVVLESAEERAIKYDAYRTALENVLHGQMLPDGVERGTQQGTWYFAVLDVDGDGRDELLIQYTTDVMAGMLEIVYDFDQETGTMREELSEFPLIAYYENGTAEAGWSHNQGLNSFDMEEFWPYNIYRYDSTQDTYVLNGMVDAWEKEVSERNYAGDSFPDEADTDGDGILYSVMGTIDEYYALDTLVDGPTLSELQNSYRGNGAQIMIPWQELTAENIRDTLAGGQTEDPYFYGTWYVWTYQMAGVSALSKDDAQGYVGTEVVYEKDCVRVNGEELQAEDFAYAFTDDFTEETLTQEYNVNLGEWWNGVAEVVCGEVNTDGNDFGSHFFVAGDEMIWIYHEGVFFLARREKPDAAVG